MKLAGKLSLVLACGVFCHGAAPGQDADAGSPYSTIAVRNSFALKDPPPPPPVDPKTVQPPQKITLLGIVSWGKLEVIFKTPVPPKPGEQPKETSFTLGVGERAGEITVEEIDPATGTVKFNNNGITDIKTLEKDGMKPSGGPPPGGTPATPSVIPAPMPVPVPAGRAPAGAGAMPGVTATGSGPTTTFGGNAAGGQFGGAATVQRPLRVTPPTTAAGYAGATGLPVPASGNPVTPSLEEHTVILEVARKLTQEKVDAGLMPPLPPTPLTGK